MAEQIVREIWLFQKRRVPAIDIVAGSQIPIALELKDFTIPAGATVKVYARPWGRETTYVQDAATTGNTVVFTPQDGFFQEGWNSVQLEIDGAKIPLALDVSGGVRLSDGGSGATPEAVRPLVERAEAAAAKAAEDAANAVKPLVTEASAAAESAAGQAAAAKSSANAAEKSAQGIRDSAAKIDKSAEEVNQLKEDLGNIDYVVVKDKVSRLSFTLEGTSSDISLNGNRIVSTNATKEQYKAFINTSLFENGRKYVVVTKYTNNGDANISVYLNAFSYRFDNSLGKAQNLGAKESVTSINGYTANSTVRGFSVYSITENASYTVDIFIYDITENKYVDKIDFAVGGAEIKNVKSDLDKPYYGKVLCTYGDSITAQQTWQDYVQRELGFSKYYNHGVGGRRLMAMATDECLAEITEDFDIMLVMGGTNDWAQDRAIGTEDDINTDDQTFTGTFYGGLNALMKKLTTKYPTKRIVFMTQTPTKNKNGESFFLKKGSADGLKNSNGDTTRDFAKATLNACGNNHVPCVDLNSLVGWNENNISSFVSNEDDMFFHPTSIGGKRMAECISGFLKSIQSIN